MSNSIIPDSKWVVILFLGLLVILSFLGVDLKSMLHNMLFSSSPSSTSDSPSSTTTPTKNNSLVAKGTTFYMGQPEKLPVANKELGTIMGLSSSSNDTNDVRPIHMMPSVSQSLETRGVRTTPKSTPEPTPALLISS